MPQARPPGVAKSVPAEGKRLVNPRFESAAEIYSSPAGGQRAVIEAAVELDRAGHAFALAIVVDTEGSTYRKRGAVALVTDDGRRVGVISGGCLEAGLEMLGREALATDAPRMMVLDTRSDDDLVFGSGTGCRGRMRVAKDDAEREPLFARHPADTVPQVDPARAARALRGPRTSPTWIGMAAFIAPQTRLRIHCTRVATDTFV